MLGRGALPPRAMTRWADGSSSRSSPRGIGWHGCIQDEPADRSRAAPFRRRAKLAATLAGYSMIAATDGPAKNVVSTTWHPPGAPSVRLPSELESGEYHGHAGRSCHQHEPCGSLRRGGAAGVPASHACGRPAVTTVGAYPSDSMSEAATPRRYRAEDDISARSSACRHVRRWTRLSMPRIRDPRQGGSLRTSSSVPACGALLARTLHPRSACNQR